MSYDDAISALSQDALNLVKDNSVLGLGSGRAATSFVKSLSTLIKENNYRIRGVPTSLQIKLVAEKSGVQLIEADQVDHLDAVFDGADQIDSQKYIIKGGGGALLKENILINMARKVIIMADESKFVKYLNRTVPVEVHPMARNLVARSIKKQLSGNPSIRTLNRGYPFFTENGNIIVDCDFGAIQEPRQLSQKIKQLAGVMESGIFTKRPTTIYKAKTKGKFQVIN